MTAGENSGETLIHEFVVLSLAYKTMVKKEDGTYTVDISLPEKNKSQAKKFSMAFWISPEDSYKPIQATGGYL